MNCVWQDVSYQNSGLYIDWLLESNAIKEAYERKWPKSCQELIKIYQVATCLQFLTSGMIYASGKGHQSLEFMAKEWYLPT